MTDGARAPSFPQPDTTVTIDKYQFVKGMDVENGFRLTVPFGGALIMKSVSLSQVVRSHDYFRFICPLQSWRQFLSLAATLCVGLTCIAVLFMAIDPGAPVAYIIVPILLGGLAPVFAALPGKFEVVTRFHAQYFLKTLDQSIVSMGYSAQLPAAGHTRRYSRSTSLFDWKEHAIVVTVGEHAITIDGPIFTLRMLQRKLID